MCNARDFMKKLIIKYGLAVSIIAICTSAYGVDDYSKHPQVNFEYKPLDNLQKAPEYNEYGESYDPQFGTVSFSVNDLSVPGNIGISIKRVHSNSDDREIINHQFGYWGVDLPYISGDYLEHNYQNKTTTGMVDGKNCTGNFQTIYITGGQESYYLSPSTYWSGKRLHIPGVGTEELLIDDSKKDLYVNGQITKSNFGITSCLSLTNNSEGVVVTGPDRTTYFFDQVVDTKKYIFEGSFPFGVKYKRKIYPSKVKDKFGNFVYFKYTSPSSSKLAKIESSEGVIVDFKDIDSDGYTDEISYNGRTIKYIYSSEKFLEKVILADGTYWIYSKELYDSPSEETVKGPAIYNGVTYLAGVCSILNPEKIKYVTVKTPYGTSIEYQTRNTYFGRTNVDPSVQPFKTYNINNEAFSNFNCISKNSLIQKTVSGKGISPLTWTYSYSQNKGKYIELKPGDYGSLANGRVSGFNITYNSTLPGSVADSENVMTTTVNTPEGKMVYFYNRDYKSLSFSKIVAMDVYDKNGIMLERKEYYYKKGPKVGNSWYRDPSVFTGMSGWGMQETLDDEYRIYYGKTITKRGTDAFIKEYLSYDIYGKVTEYSEYSNTSDRKKHYRLSYKNSPNNYIVSLPWKEEISQDGINFFTTREILYHDFSNTGLYHDLKIPYEYREFGDWVTRNVAYHSDGNVKRVEFNQKLLNKDSGYTFIEYSGYYRGKPQYVKVPSRYDSDSTISYSQIIDDNGWIKSITDSNGNSKFFEYDKAGRIKLIKAPGVDDTVISYDFGSQNYGMTVEVTQAKFKNIVSLDALMRPVLDLKYDISDYQGTKSFQKFSYNSDNKIVYQSFKGNSEYSDVGIYTEYDVLGRKLKTEVGKERNATTFEYLDGNLMKVTNPKGSQTTTRFLSYSAPDNKLPVSINQPESVVTVIDYNLFDNITLVAQGGYQQRFVYNNKQELCLTKRPELGIDVYQYNNIGKIEKSAKGLSGLGFSCIDYIDGPNNWTYTNYDNLHDIKKVVFSDGTKPVEYTYDSVGNLIKLDTVDSLLEFKYNNQYQVTKEFLTVDDFIFGVYHSYTTQGTLSGDSYFVKNRLDFSTINSASVSFKPNALGQPTEVSSGNIYYAKGGKYFPNGVLNSFEYGNGISYEATLDGSDRIFETVQKNNFGIIQSNVHYYDKNNNLESITDVRYPFNNLYLTYDLIDRLRTADGSWGSVRYDYDQLSNFKSKNENGSITNYTYNQSTNRLESFGNRRFLYDDFGNVVDNGLRTFKYNAMQQLVTSGSNLKYVYDGLGRLVKKIVNGKNIYSFYNKAGKIIQRLDSSRISTFSLYLDSRLIAELDVTGPEITTPAPVITITVSQSMVPSGEPPLDCPKNMVCESAQVPKYNYSWKTSDASSCSGTLKSSNSGVSSGSTILSGTTGQGSVVSQAASTLYTITMTCSGAGGQRTEIAQFGGVGEEI